MLVSPCEMSLSEVLASKNGENPPINAHRLGELSFKQKYGVDLRDLAELFTRRSPHRRKLECNVAFKG